MKKLFSLFLILLIAASLLAGCAGDKEDASGPDGASSSPSELEASPSATPEPTPTPEPAGLSDAASRQGNLQSGGHYAEEDGVLYYSLPDMGIQSKAPGDASGTALYPGDASKITVDNGIIYFIADGAMRYMNTDGSGLGVLRDGGAVSMIVHDDWIYYTAGAATQLYRIRLDDNTEVKLGEQKVYSPQIVDDRLYYISYVGEELNAEYAGFFSMNLDGSDVTKLSDIEMDGYIIDDGRIYYKEMVDRIIHSMKLDGSDDQVLSTDGASFMTMSNGFIFYVVAPNDFFNPTNANYGELCRMKTDGSDLYTVTGGGEEIIARPHVIGDRIYFYCMDAFTGEGSWQEIGIDGSNRQAAQ